MDKANQHRIFDDWLGRHTGLLLKVVRAYAFTAHDRDDLFQEIAVQVFNSIPNFNRDSAVTTWLYRVALYTAISWTRSEKKHSRRSQSLSGVEHILSSTTATADPRLEWLYGQIAQLDEIDRSLTLLLLDGFSYKQMAETLGISESNVGVKIHRIKKHLTNLSQSEHDYELQ